MSANENCTLCTFWNKYVVDMVLWWLTVSLLVSPTGIHFIHTQRLSQCQLISSTNETHTMLGCEHQVNKNDFIVRTIHCSNVIQNLYTKSAVNSIYLHARRAPFSFNRHCCWLGWDARQNSFHWAGSALNFYFILLVCLFFLSLALCFS